MTSTKLHPVAVAKYSSDLIADAIRHVTGWTQKSEVLDKAHLNYLNRYLQKMNAATIVIENEYIDRHYIEDYVEYYARCFHQHPRTCSRIHFFHDEFTEAEFTDAVAGANPDLLKKITKEGRYIGFVVLRPIPKTCIARMCLKPYDFDGKNVKLLKNKVSVSLFGIDLEVEALSFLEQDKVVSACATSAIWVLLHAHNHASPDGLPSPSAITKSAFSPTHDDGRVFPANGGLKLPQVARSLKAYGLEPTMYTRDEIGEDDFLTFVTEVIYAYAASEIPVLLGGNVFECSDGKETVELGRHLVCALGYRVKGPKTALTSPSAIDQIYVHDDRYGPYVALSTENGSGLEFRWTNRNGDDGLAERFIPEAVIVGLHHKVRVDYPYVRNLCVSIQDVIKFAFNCILSADPGADVSALKTFSECAFVITLETTASVKRDIRNCSGFFSYNGGQDKTSLLLQNLPRYLWRCRFVDKENLFVDFLIDATEVPQGNLILGGAQYDHTADEFWRLCKTIADNAEIVSMISANCDSIAKPFVSTFVRFFSAKDNDALNSYFGPLRLPNRAVRAGEFDSFGNTIRLSNIMHINYGDDPSHILKSLKTESTYLWVIDEDGNLILGEEPESNASNDENGGLAGHPTLTRSRAARLGGEMRFVDGKWALNSKSGTYSTHIRGDDLRKQYLDNVIRLSFRGSSSVTIASK